MLRLGTSPRRRRTERFTRLVGALSLEQNDDRQLRHRHMQLEALQSVSENPGWIVSLRLSTSPIEADLTARAPFSVTRSIVSIAP